MNKIYIFNLKVCKIFYQKLFGHSSTKHTYNIVTTPQESSDIIYEYLVSPSPCMIARYGGHELNVVLNYLSVIEKDHSILKYIKGEIYDWWWNEKGLNFFSNNAGFFPLEEDYLFRFGELMVNDSKSLDVLGSWLDMEDRVVGNNKKLKRVSLLCMEPYWANIPWTRALKGKKVLVVHPFANLIEKQYNERRTHLFKNPDVLPEFELKTLQAVQSIGGYGGKFNTWFDALHYMEEEIDKRDYDIALIGCGAYGFPLAAHVKRKRKKAIHLGGALQLLFGIKGRRWEIPNYGGDILGRKNPYPALFNEYWCRPGEDVKPAKADKVEGACYW